MGELLVTLIVPPIVGMVVFIVVRHIWKRDENASGDGVYALNKSDGTVVFGDGIQGAVPPSVQSNVEASNKVNVSCARKNYPHGPMCNFVLDSSLNRIESDLGRPVSKP